MSAQFGTGKRRANKGGIVDSSNYRSVCNIGASIVMVYMVNHFVKLRLVKQCPKTCHIQLTVISKTGIKQKLRAALVTH